MTRSEHSGAEALSMHEATRSLSGADRGADALPGDSHFESLSANIDPAFGAGAGASDAETVAAQATSSSGGRRRSRRGGRRRRSSKRSAMEASAPDGAEQNLAVEQTRSGGEAPKESTGSPRKPRRARRKSTGTRGKRTGARSADSSPSHTARVQDSAASEGHSDPGVSGSEGTSGKESRRRRRGSRGGRRRKKGVQGSDQGQPLAVDVIPGEEDDLPELPLGSERIERADSRAAKSAHEDADARPARQRAEKPASGAAKRTSRRGRKRPSGAAVEQLPAEEAAQPLGKPSNEGGSGSEAKRGDKAGSRSANRKAATQKKAKSRKKAASKEKQDDTEAKAEAQTGSASRQRRRKSASQSEKTLASRRSPTARAVSGPHKILVNASDREETRVAVVSGEKIVDFKMAVASERSHVNDIYRGRVVNLEPSIGAAFVDFGRGRNGFLHTSDVLPVYGEKGWSIDKILSTEVDADEWEALSSQPSLRDEVLDEELEESRPSGKSKRGAKRPRFQARPRLPITDLLRKGSQVVVQVTKDAIGDKGPTLTTYLSITGHYLVLMPFLPRRGVSRKIESLAERKRLRKIVDQLEVPEGMGVIVRTAGEKRTKVELERDLAELLDSWRVFGKRLRSGSGPMLLYQEPQIALRAVRDWFGPETEKVVVDDRTVFDEIRGWAERVMPEYADRIHLHEGPRPIFNTYGIEQDFEKIFARRVDLPSGGSIVFDQTEALVAIDVNSGRTRGESNDFEEVALKTNLEAVPEIARQIRLRDLGGILVIDFIDMTKRADIRRVERAFRDELARDRARSKTGRISQFGLLEMTRQRLGAGMSKKVFESCPHCRGTGRARTVRSQASAILRRLGSALTLKGFSQVEVRAHPETIEYLERHCFDELRALEERSQRKLILTSVPDQIEDSVLRYLRADGREVRPGGRRKR